MRILHILPHLSSGGAERQFSYLAPELICMNHNLNVAYLSNGPLMPSLSGVDMQQLSARNNYDPNILWQLIRLIQRTKPDIVHTWILQMDILGGMAARLTRTPWIFREPSSAAAYSMSWKHRLRVLIGRGANAIVSNSLGGDEYWKAQLPHSCHYIIYNGLPVHEIDKAVAALPPGLAKLELPIVLFVGRIVVSKNMINILKALSSTKQQYPLLFVICGDGPQRPELETLVRKFGLSSNVHFTGYLVPTMVWALMKKATVFISLSAYEGCPNAVMEAMASGCPLILSDIPAHREILDENSALFVDPLNLQMVLNAIIQTLTDVDSAKARALLAKQKTVKWSIAKMARRYNTVYNDVLSHHLQIIGKRRKPATEERNK